MELKTNAIASESGHWYRMDGEPAYTIIGKNGKERNTTLRDARTENLVPSVTTILRCAAAPGLEKWKRDQLLMAALTLPKLDGESLDDYARRVEQDAQEQGKQAMELGTSIHGSLERAYQRKDYPTDHEQYVFATIKAITETFGDQSWSAEKSFAHGLGFGGKVDLHSKLVVIDFKTSAFGPDDKKTGYDEHKMQLAAYSVGLGLDTPRAANVFISTTHPGLIKIVEWTPDDLRSGWQMFRSLLDFYKVKNNFMVQ